MKQYLLLFCILSSSVLGLSFDNQVTQQGLVIAEDNTSTQTNNYYFNSSTIPCSNITGAVSDLCTITGGNGTSVNLSNYYNKTEVDEIVRNISTGNISVNITAFNEYDCIVGDGATDDYSDINDALANDCRKMFLKLKNNDVTQYELTSSYVIQNPKKPFWIIGEDRNRVILQFNGNQIIFNGTQKYETPLDDCTITQNSNYFYCPNALFLTNNITKGDTFVVDGDFWWQTFKVDEVISETELYTNTIVESSDKSVGDLAFRDVYSDVRIESLTINANQLSPQSALIAYIGAGDIGYSIGGYLAGIDGLSLKKTNWFNVSNNNPFYDRSGIRWQIADNHFDNSTGDMYVPPKTKWENNIIYNRIDDQGDWLLFYNQIYESPRLNAYRSSTYIGNNFYGATEPDVSNTKIAQSNYWNGGRMNDLVNNDVNIYGTIFSHSTTDADQYTKVVTESNAYRAELNSILQGELIRYNLYKNQYYWRVLGKSETDPYDSGIYGRIQTSCKTFESGNPRICDWYGEASSLWDTANPVFQEFRYLWTDSPDLGGWIMMDINAEADSGTAQSGTNYLIKGRYISNHIFSIDTNGTFNLTGTNAVGYINDSQICTMETGCGGSAYNVDSNITKLMDRTTSLEAENTTRYNEIRAVNTTANIQSLGFYTNTETNNTIDGKLATTTYYPTEFAIMQGTGTGNNNIANLSYLDNNYFNVTEGAGATSILLNINFTSVTQNITNLRFTAKYIGSTNHQIYAEIYNYATASWETMEVIASGTTYMTYNYPVYSSNYLSGEKVQIRFRHPQNGIAGHILSVDETIAQKGIVVTGSTGALDPRYVFLDGTNSMTGNLTFFGGNGVNASYILNPYWLSLTDQRYNETSLIGGKLDATDQRYNETALTGTANLHLHSNLNITGSTSTTCNPITQRMYNVTLTNGQLSSLCGTDATGAGTTISNIRQKSTIYTSSTTGWQSTDMVFGITANGNYTMHCNILFNGSAATIGQAINVSYTGTAKNIVVAYDTWSSATAKVTLSAEAFRTALTGTGSGAGIINQNQIVSDFESTGNGNLALTIRAETTGSTGFYRGSRCQLITWTDGG